jgi:hypothetical protein
MAHPMKCLRDEHGLCHFISDGPSPSRLFALCDIVNAINERNTTQDAWDRAGMRGIARTKPPDRNWGEEDVVDAIVTCLTCVATVKEMIGA